MSLMVSPAFLLGMLLIIGYGGLFHLIAGRHLRDLAWFLLAATLGFAVGQFVGTFTQVGWMRIGQVHTVEATLGAWLAMIAVRVISQVDLVDGGRQAGGKHG